MSDKDKANIVFTKYSPYLTVDLDKVEEENGKEHKLNKVSALCRCGKSKIKPYCDGTHVEEGFNGDKSEDRANSKLRDYVGNDITIHFNFAICAHKGACVKNLPSVFDIEKKPWIDPNGARVNDIIETIRKCPSGALSYTFDAERVRDWEQVEKIKIVKNGPYEIEGGIKLKDDMETIDELESKQHYCLCRCGESKNKPLCDGEHHKIKFDDE